MASLGIPIFTGSLDDFDEHPVSNVVATKPAVKNVLNNLFVFFFVLSFYNFTYQSNIYNPFPPLLFMK